MGHHTIFRRSHHGGTGHHGGSSHHGHQGYASHHRYSSHHAHHEQPMFGHTGHMQLAVPVHQHHSFAHPPPPFVPVSVSYPVHATAQPWYLPHHYS